MNQRGEERRFDHRPPRPLPHYSSIMLTCKISCLFRDSPGLAAQGLYNAARIARARGEKDRAARMERSFRKLDAQSSPQ